MMNLYTCIVLEVDPLINITQLTNKCYLKEDINSFNINE